MAAAPPARSPQALMDEIVEEIILRLPPAEPASLVRAALVCKPWFRFVSSPRFRRRFREFHRTPSMLGFIRNTSRKGLAGHVARFVSTSSFHPPRADLRDWVALDAHHGYVLLSTALFTTVDSEVVQLEDRLLVWNPVTDEWWQLPPLVQPTCSWNRHATVLCAASGASHHLDCLHATFLVVLVADDIVQTTLMVYSSESGSWSQRALVPHCHVDELPTALVGSTIYYSIDSGHRILSYDMATQETHVIFLPPNFIRHDAGVMIMEDGDGGVGVTIAEWSTHSIPLWSMETSPSGDIGWAQIRVIELQKLLYGQDLSMYTPVGSTRGIFFFTTDDGLFSINLKSDEVKKELDNDGNRVQQVIPYMGFYTPEFRALTGVGPRAGV